MSNCLVYYSEGRATSWIGDAAGEVLANEFKMMGFNIVNAVELRQRLEDAVRKNEAGKYVVVFARDAVPHDVFDIVNKDTPQLPQTGVVNPRSDIPPETLYAETLLVKFLHGGGNIVWLGDVPFWYVTNPQKPTETLQLWVWPHINFFAILGVFQVFNLIPQLTYGDIANLGMWLSKRPVLISQKLIININKNKKKMSNAINECREKNGFIPLIKTFVLYGAITNWSVVFPDGSTYDMIEPLSKELQITVIISKSITEFNIKGGVGILLPILSHIMSLKGEVGYRWVSERETQQMVATQLSFSAGRPITGLFEAYPAWIRCVGKGLFIRLWDYEIRLDGDGNATVTKEEVKDMAGKIRDLLEKLGIKCPNN